MADDLSSAAAWYAWFKVTGGHELRRLVMNTWDPIGVAGIPEALDEYDGYLGKIAQLLRAHVSADDLADHLQQIRTEAMGLPPDRSLDVSVAEALIAWYEESRPR